MISNVLPLHFAPSQASSSQNSNVDNFQLDCHILLKSLLTSLVLYELLLFPFNANNPITVITYFQCSGIWYGSIGNLMLSSQCQQTTTLYTETRLIYVEIMAPLLQNKPYTYFLVKISSCSTILLTKYYLFHNSAKQQKPTLPLPEVLVQKFEF